MTKVTHERKHLIGLSFQRVRVHANPDREYGGKQIGIRIEQKLKSHILRYRYEAETHKYEGLAWAFQISNIIPSDTPPNPSQTLPSTGEQTFNYKSLWGPFSFNPHR